MIPSGSQLLPAQKPQTFQIISPGYDGDYGFGGIFNATDAGLATVTLKNFRQLAY